MLWSTSHLRLRSNYHRPIAWRLAEASFGVRLVSLLLTSATLADAGNPNFLAPIDDLLVLTYGGMIAAADVRSLFGCKNQAHR